MNKNKLYFFFLFNFNFQQIFTSETIINGLIVPFYKRQLYYELKDSDVNVTKSNNFHLDIPFPILYIMSAIELNQVEYTKYLEECKKNIEKPIEFHPPHRNFPNYYYFYKYIPLNYYLKDNGVFKTDNDFIILRFAGFSANYDKGIKFHLKIQKFDTINLSLDQFIMKFSNRSPNYMDSEIIKLTTIAQKMITARKEKFVAFNFLRENKKFTQDLTNLPPDIQNIILSYLQ